MTPAARLADGVATLGLAALVGPDAQARLLAYLALLDALYDSPIAVTV